MTCGEWDYKFNDNWRVPSSYGTSFSDSISLPNARNWVPWIYFEGHYMDADKFVNLNLGYVGALMGFSTFMLLNPLTSGDGDGYWIEYGINMAMSGRL